MVVARCAAPETPINKSKRAKIIYISWQSDCVSGIEGAQIGGEVSELPPGCRDRAVSRGFDLTCPPDEEDALLLPDIHMKAGFSRSQSWRASGSISKSVLTAVSPRDCHTGLELIAPRWEKVSRRQGSKERAGAGRSLPSFDLHSPGVSGSLKRES